MDSERDAARARMRATIAAKARKRPRPDTRGDPSALVDWSMMTDEEKALEQRICRRWGEESRFALERVVDLALKFNAEKARSDGAHSARQSKLESRLLEAIQRAARHFEHRALTWGDLEQQRQLDRVFGIDGNKSDD